MCEKYNGWSNYQTWVFNLWFDAAFEDVAERFFRDCDTPTQAITELEIFIKAYAEELNPLGDGASAWTDLLGHAVGMIDFREIARHYIDEPV